MWVCGTSRRKKNRGSHVDVKSWGDAELKKKEKKRG